MNVLLISCFLVTIDLINARILIDYPMLLIRSALNCVPFFNYYILLMVFLLTSIIGQLDFLDVFYAFGY